MEHKPIKISSFWTWGLLIGIYFLLLLLPFIFLGILLSGEKFHIGMVIGGFGIIGFAILAVYLSKRLSHAYVVGNTIQFKRAFRPAETVRFDQLGYPTAFHWKTTKYITVPVTTDEGKERKYVLINSRSLLAFERKDAEAVLLAIYHQATEARQARMKAAGTSA